MPHPRRCDPAGPGGTREWRRGPVEWRGAAGQGAPASRHRSWWAAHGGRGLGASPSRSHLPFPRWDPGAGLRESPRFCRKTPKSPLETHPWPPPSLTLSQTSWGEHPCGSVPADHWKSRLNTLKVQFDLKQGTAAAPQDSGSPCPPPCHRTHLGVTARGQAVFGVGRWQQTQGLIPAMSKALHLNHGAGAETGPTAQLITPMAALFRSTGMDPAPRPQNCG